MKKEIKSKEFINIIDRIKKKLPNQKNSRDKEFIAIRIYLESKNKLNSDQLEEIKDILWSRIKYIKKKIANERINIKFIEREKREKREKKQKVIVKEILPILESFDFFKADKLFIENKKVFNKPPFTKLTYEKEKAKNIQKYFEEKFVKKGIIENAPDLEQAEAIGALGKNILVSARAGSGKTQTISGKVAFLVNKYDVKPGEILVLCFNKSAEENMKKRIQKFIPDFQNAKTFHSLCWLIVSPEKGSVLFDNDGEFSPKKYSDFVKKIIEDYEKKYPEFKKKIYNFFREEYEKLDENLSETKSFENKKERYLYLRNQTETTLSGVNVKSRGEKWIADFLFEHGIEFYYEQQFSWEKLDEKSYYHPDFTIKVGDKKYILEHWGIDENDPKKEVPDFWTKTWEEYKKEMANKRNYFKNNDKYKDKFIETSICDIDYALDIKEQRFEFEKILRSRLEKKGIKCKKLSTNELIKKAWEKQLFTRLNTLICQFIGWMQKLEWEEKDLTEELKKGIYNEKQKVFCEIGLKIYEKYKAELEKEKKIDFNILVSKAIQKIKNGEFCVSQFKHILIDEFQDFSQLFQNLIDVIRDKNQNVNLFCVGDDWQLINGFAGSDEKFFRKFKEKANTRIISTCYRSTLKVIENGNNFAKKYKKTFIGKESKNNKRNKGEIKNIYIDKVYIENNARNKKADADNEFKEYFRIDTKEKDEKFLSSSDYIKVRYLKKCFEIIENNPDKSFLFLARKKRLKGLDLYKFFDKDFNKEDSYLAKVLKVKEIKFPNNLKFQTMHSSKGLEADIVIPLDICEKTIPSIHPSNELFEIFGRTHDKILDEEKRLFYVAITRAKEKLFILTEQGNESEFIV